MSYSNDIWNSWTIKSVNIPFKSTEIAVGDGEQKLGVEFDVVPLGQNFAYDLEINGERWEVKKLDSDNSFRLGVEVATHYTPIISNVIRILEKLIIVKSHILDSEIGNFIKDCILDIENISGRSNTLLLDGLRKNEVSESNLDKANDVISKLKSILLYQGTMTLYSSVNGLKQDYNILDAFRKIIIENISIDDKISLIGDKDVYNRLLITNLIFDDISIFDNHTLREKLNQIIRSVFNNVKLVLVHENYGYKPITNLQSIYCNRITSGLPRCKLT
ncbi:hypothetical protein GCM10011508_07180 [Flavobacterium lutivivi]|nr:hypothetical protein GCM10011508_07180 [Flavobacterium lutivivi]